MKRSTLIQNLAIRYKYLNHSQVERVVEKIFKHFSNALANNQRIELRSFGSFHIKARNARTARNPKTGQSVQVGVRKSIAYRMAKDLKYRVNSNRTPIEIDKIIEDMYDGKI
jgi:integration host factor subunit beta